jgi:hypothetical protein
MPALVRACSVLALGCGVVLAAAVMGDTMALSAEPAAPSAVPREYHLVFTSDRDGDKDVYTVGEGGGRLAALTRNRVDDSFLAVAPSGWFYVYRGSRGFLVSPDGRRARNLGFAYGDAAFAPDGRQLAYAREDAMGEGDRVAVVPVASGPIRYLGSGLPDAFSSDGRYLAFVDEGAVGVIDLRTRQRMLLPPIDADKWVWSPQLARLAYIDFDEQLVVVGARARSPAKVLEQVSLQDVTWLDDDHLGVFRFVGEDAEILVFDVEAGTRRVVARVGTWPEGYGLGYATWSPRRDAVAYVAGNPNTGPATIVVAPLAGGETRFEVPGRIAGDLTWSPGGDAIAVELDSGELGVLDLVPSPRLRRVARGVGEALSVEWSPDGRTLAVRRRSGVALVPAAGGALHEVPGLRSVETLWWARGPVPRTAPTAIRPPELDTATHRLGRPLPSSGTLASLAGTVTAFAQDGNRLAWVRDAASSEAPFPSVVEVLDVAGRTRTTIGGIRRDPDTLNPGLHPAGFALGGGRALLVDVSGGVCGLSNCYFGLLAASLRDRHLRHVESMQYESEVVDRGLPVLTAGDAGTIVYYARCFSTDDCGGAGSVLRRLSGPRPLTIFRLAENSFPTALALAGNRLALAERVGEGATTTVSVRAAAHGALIRQFAVAGRVSSLALSPTRVAALAQSGGRTRIELRDTRSGSILRSVQVPRASSAISIAGNRVVFHTGRTIRLLDVRTGRTSTLATAASSPIGLAIEGTRVAWAERLRDRARIRVITFGAR